MSKKMTVLELLSRYANDPLAKVLVEDYVIKRFAQWPDGGAVVELNDCMAVDEHGYIRSLMKLDLEKEPRWHQGRHSFSVHDEHGVSWAFSIHKQVPIGPDTLSDEFVQKCKDISDTLEALRVAKAEIEEMRKQGNTAMTSKYLAAKFALPALIQQLENS